MRDRLVELLYRAHHNAGCVMYEGGSEEEILEEEARYLLKYSAILPPCKVGDTVYYINLYNHIMLYKDRVYEASVSRIVVTKCGVSVAIVVHGGHAVNEIPGVEFGKNVFLTREEAEQALKGG